MTTTPRLTAVPIYPETHTFPYLNVVKDVDADSFTAYGLRRLDSPCTLLCDFCGQTGANALVEDGAQGAPTAGVPVHTMCCGGVIARTEDVTLVST